MNTSAQRWYYREKPKVNSMINHHHHQQNPSLTKQPMVAYWLAIEMFDRAPEFRGSLDS